MFALNSEKQEGAYVIQDMNEDSIDLFLANSQLTSEKTLDALAESINSSVVEAIAHNKNTGISTLYRLANHANPRIRAAVAQNPYVPFEVLDFLCNDNHPDVRFAIAENPRLPKFVLTNLLRDENPFVAFRAASTLQRLQREVDRKRSSLCVASLAQKQSDPQVQPVSEQRRGNSSFKFKVEKEIAKLLSIMLSFGFVVWETMADKEQKKNH